MAIQQPDTDEQEPAEFIRDRFDDHREAIEGLAELDLGELSEDAERILAILDQEDSS